MRTGGLLVFEGVDAVGKTTISNAVAAALTGDRCRPYAFPGREDGTIGSLVYRLHHDATALGIGRISQSSLQAMHVAAHLDAIESVILPAIAAGTTVVLDRFWWSTWVYGCGAGVQPALLRALIDAEKIAWGDLSPSAVFYLTREKPLGIPDSDTWSDLKSRYADLVQNEKMRYPVHVVENERTVENAVATVLSFLQKEA